MWPGCDVWAIHTVGSAKHGVTRFATWRVSGPMIIRIHSLVTCTCLLLILSISTHAGSPRPLNYVFVHRTLWTSDMHWMISHLVYAPFVITVWAIYVSTKIYGSSRLQSTYFHLLLLSLTLVDYRKGL